MLRTLVTATVLIALSPGLALAEKHDFDSSLMNNVYHPGTDVNEYVVFAQSTWPRLWINSNTGEDNWPDIRVNGDTYVNEERHRFYASQIGDRVPTARLWVGPNRKCVVSFRPTIGQVELAIESYGTLASDAAYPIEGIVGGVYNPEHHSYDPRVDSYYYNRMQEIGQTIDYAVEEENCSRLIAVGWSMGGALAQLYAYRSWAYNLTPKVDEVYGFNPGPVGNGDFRHIYNAQVALNGHKSEIYCRLHDPVKIASKLAYFDPSDVNWELGCDFRVGVAVGSYYNNQGAPPNHDLRTWRSCGDPNGAPSELQCPDGEGETIDWLSQDDNDPVYGTEGAYRGNFLYTTQGTQPDGYECVQVRSGNTHDFDDNFFCSWQEIGMEWTTAGEIAGKRCTHVVEAHNENEWGQENYLCIQTRSDYVLQWISNGLTGDNNCVQWYEPKVESWFDNYLCWEAENSGGIQLPPPTEVIPIPPTDNNPPNNPPNSGDQCDTTGQCRDEYGDGATDCRDSNSSSSVCMCGAERCDAGDNGNDNGNSNNGNGNSNNGNNGGDQCNTTQDCRDDFGSGATDCRDSNSSSSVCICGENRCDGG